MREARTTDAAERLEALQAQLTKLRTEFEKLTEAVTDGLDETRGKARKILTDAKEYAAQAKDYAVHAKDYARDRAYAAEHAVEDTVKDHPLSTLMVAAGVGFVIGALMRR
ncbi:MAG: DUF883 family protein [Alphaproteobacteria bacterium]|nr:DUF883 family protein [Alphaproteobacteria bacterium]